jgi:uroporphyrinogen-III synthase
MRRPAILVIRPDDSFSRILRENGSEVINLELIKTVPVDDRTELTETFKRLGEYDGVFITSPVAAEIFVECLKSEGLTYSGKVYALGGRSREVLAGHDLTIVYDEAANTARDLIETFSENECAGGKLLFVRGDRSIRTIPLMLESTARVDELVVYRTLDSTPDAGLVKAVKDRLNNNDIERVCFFSPSGVKGFIKIFGAEDISSIKGSAIGETTAASARELGINIEFISQRAAAEDFAAGLAAYLKSIE